MKFWTHMQFEDIAGKIIQKKNLYIDSFVNMFNTSVLAEEFDS